MRRLIFSVLLSLGIISISGRAFSQTNSFPWPSNPPVGIGTKDSMGIVPINALQIHYDTSLLATTMPAIIRLSNGGLPTTNVFGILGLMPPLLDAEFSSLSKKQDLILHENKSGDIIITNF